MCVVVLSGFRLGVFQTVVFFVDLNTCGFEIALHPGGLFLLVETI